MRSVVAINAKCSDWNKQKWQPPTCNVIGSKIPMHRIHEVICDYHKASSERFDSFPIQSNRFCHLSENRLENEGIVKWLRLWAANP